MRTLVESYKRLYSKGKIDKAYLAGKVEDKTITKAEYKYITGETYKA